MELRHVRTFLALVEELHFGRAARRLRVAQSAVSQTIRALEEDVGAQLFARTKRSVALTPAGRELVGPARRAIDELERAAAAARRASAGDTGQLVLGLSLSGSLTAVPRVVAKFQRERPHVHLHIQSRSSAELLAAIRDGQCDIGLVPAFKDEFAPLAAQIVQNAVLVAFVSKRHALAKRASIDLKELAEEPFIFLEQAREPEIRLRFWRRCAEAGFAPKVLLEIEQLDALLAFVAAGVGIACAPSFVGQLHHRGIVAVRLRPAMRAHISAVWHPKRLPATGQRFLELLRVELAGGAAGGGEHGAK